MMGSDNLRVLYKEFFDWMERPEMFSYAKRSAFEYSDLFPLMYLKIQMEGVDSINKVKHLIVDEMQDYTAVQYAVLSKLFPCNKTILGDANQNVNPYSSTTSEQIQEIFSETEAVTLTKSYRSTWEIPRFTLRISPRADVDAVERHGEQPEILDFSKTIDEEREFLSRIEEFRASNQHTLGILCKTQKQAKVLHTYLKKHDKEISLFPLATRLFSREC